MKDLCDKNMTFVMSLKMYLLIFCSEIPFIRYYFLNRLHFADFVM